MGYLKPSAKGLTSWQRGVWLGKTQSNDAHIISRNGGLFVTRSVRRNPTPWIFAKLGQHVTWFEADGTKVCSEASTADHTCIASWKCAA